MKTLVVGSAIIDIIMKIDRLPLSGEDIICNSTKTVVGGCAYNVASTLKNMNCNYDLCVPIGRGNYANIIKTQLLKDGDKILIEDENEDNGYCLTFVENNGERTFITVQGIESKFKSIWFENIDMNQYENIYISGYQIVGEYSNEIICWLKKLEGKRIFFAPGPVICSIQSDVLKEIFELSPILHLNKKEISDYTCIDDLESAINNLQEKTNNTIIVTLGADGTIYNDLKNINIVPTVKSKVVDTIGAGDSHIGAIIASLSKGLSLHESIEVANLVASSIVQVEGPVMDLDTFNKIVKGEMKNEYIEKLF